MDGVYVHKKVNLTERSQHCFSDREVTMQLHAEYIPFDVRSIEIPEVQRKINIYATLLHEKCKVTSYDI